MDLVPSVIESPSTTTDPGPPPTSTPVSSGRLVRTEVYGAPDPSAVWSPLPLTYDRCAPSLCTGTAATVPGRWKLTSRSAPAGTSKPSGSLNACAPAGISTPDAPANATATGLSRAAAPTARTATLAPPIRTGTAAKVLSNRSRTRGPPTEVCTTSRSVRSVHGPTAWRLEVAAAQLPLQPNPLARTDRAKTCMPGARGSRTEATSRSRASGTVTTYSRACSVS